MSNPCVRLEIPLRRIVRSPRGTSTGNSKREPHRSDILDDDVSEVRHAAGFGRGEGLPPPAASGHVDMQLPGSDRNAREIEGGFVGGDRPGREERGLLAGP